MEALAADDGEQTEPVLTALCAPCLDALLQWLRRQGHQQALWVDLSSGGWQPRQAAAELAGQLGIVLPPCEDSGHGAAFDTDQPSYAGIIGSGVDAEARGERPVITAHRDAGAIAAELARHPLPVMIIAPRFGFSWRQENIWFIRFLRRHLPLMGVPLLLAAPEIAEVPPGPWTLHWETLSGASDPTPSATSVGVLIPGLVPPDARPLLETCSPAPRTLSLASGYRLIAPEQRTSPASLPRTTLDRFTAAAQALPWMHAFGQSFGNNLFVDSPGLTDLAWQAFAQGSNELALELLERAVTCAKTPVEKAVCQARAQGIRIATQRFSEVAAVPQPSRALPAGLREFILQTKGWGMVMAGDAVGAESCFSQPLVALCNKPSRDVEDLYLLNIYALARLRQGQAEQALELERQIEAEHDALPHPDHRLTYINGINLARLYRKRGELRQAQRYYAKAFATSEGARGPSEAVHWNLIQASMHEALGMRQAAHDCWLRAALHWLASDVPEGLGNRVMQALLGRSPQPGEDLLQSASAMLLERLGGAVSAGLHATPAIVPSDTLAPGTIEAGFGAAGWSLLVARQRPTQQPRPGAWRQLARRVWRLLAPAASACLGSDKDAMLVVDDRHGRELAQDPPSLLAAALEWDIPLLCWEGHRLDLSSTQRQRLLQASRLGLGPAVDLLQLDQDFAFATFKRYFPPRPLSPAETRLLSAARDGQRYADAAGALELPPGETLTLTRRLLAERLMTIAVTEDACTEVGINWPTSET